MTVEVRSKLTDLAHWLGADAFHYVNIVSFFQSVEEHHPESPYGVELLKALDIVHKVMDKVKDGK